jgi:hypothetical protein
MLMGVFALALPLGTMAVLSPAALAKALPNPISCTNFGGTVTFGTPITKAGVPTASKLALNTTISGGVFNCAPGTGNGHNGTITILGQKNTKLAKTDPRYNKTLGIKYVTGSQAEFIAAGGTLKKTLKVVNFTVNGNPVQFKTKSAVEVIGGATCPGEVGFVISGQVKLPPYNTKAASITACLGQDSGPGTVNSFGVDLFSPTAKMVTATIDPALSKATL